MTLTVDLPKDTMLKLKALALRFNMTPEEKDNQSQRIKNW
jgi:hypothetical protein